MADESYRFKFIDKKFESISGKENRDNLIKWGMRGKLRTFMYTFDKQFHLGKKNSFIKDFFNDESVLSTLQKLETSGTWKNLNVKASKVNVEDIDCSLLSVELFDRLTEKDIVRENGSIRKCLDEYYEDMQISDELRKLLILEECDNYDIYNKHDRNQFLFCLFKHLCLGASVCQFEDNIQPYVDTARSIYKELIRRSKDPNTKQLKIVSFVFKIEVFDERGKKYYPTDNVIEQDFCYLIIDPYKRHIIVLYHRFDGPLFIE